MRSRALAFAAAVVAALSLTACSSPGSTTCTEYAALSSNDRDDVVTRMVKDHDLDPYSNVYGLVSLQQDVDNFCDVGLGSTGRVKNGAQAIEKGVRWSEYTS